MLPVFAWVRRQIALTMLRRFQVPRDAIRWALNRHANRTALITAARTLSFRELQERTLRLANSWASLGLRKGDIVLAQVADGHEQVEMRLAAYESGVILVAFPLSTSVDLLTEAAVRLSPRALIAGPDTPAARLVAGAAIPVRILLGADYEQRLAAHAPLPVTEPLAASEIAALGFTSGTTGKPKILATHHGAVILSLLRVLQNTNLRGAGLPPGPSLVGIPLCGAGSGLLIPTLLSGNPLIIPSAYDAPTLAQLLREHRPVRLFTTPSLLIDLLDLPAGELPEPSPLRNLIYGTELTPAPKIEEALRRFGPILQQGYGSAEVLPPLAMLHPADHWVDGRPAPREVLSSSGTPSPEVRVRILDEDGVPVPTQGIGLIQVKSDTQFLGYWQQNGLVPENRPEGIGMGDYGYLDQAGRLHVLGRSPDLIRRSGHVTYPRHVEEVLHDHPAVKETAYVQVGEQAVMAVSLRRAYRQPARPAAWERELGEFLAARVLAADRPDAVRVFDELPRSYLCKVLRREVRARLQAEYAAAAAPAAPSPPVQVSPQ